MDGATMQSGACACGWALPAVGLEFFGDGPDPRYTVHLRCPQCNCEFSQDSDTALCGPLPDGPIRATATRQKGN